jgi:hypothetical protein
MFPESRRLVRRIVRFRAKPARHRHDHRHRSLTVSFCDWSLRDLAKTANDERVREELLTAERLLARYDDLRERLNGRKPNQAPNKSAGLAGSFQWK